MLVLRETIRQCEAALDTSDPGPGLREAIQAALTAIRELGDDDPSTQLLDLEFEADRVEVLGVERVKARLAYARAVLKL